MPNTEKITQIIGPVDVRFPEFELHLHEAEQLKEFKELPCQEIQDALINGKIDIENYPYGLLCVFTNQEGKMVYQALEKPDKQGGMDIYRKPIIDATLNILQKPKKNDEIKLIFINLPSRAGSSYALGFNKEECPNSLLAKLKNSQYFTCQGITSIDELLSQLLLETKIALIDE